MPDPAASSCPLDGAPRAPRIIADVKVSTASAIITHPDDPYMVLVANSAKHANPVIPGGKIERSEPVGTDAAPGLECVTREAKEEAGTVLLNPRYIGKANDPERDVRIVAPRKVATALTTPSFDTLNLEGIADDQPCIRASYGTPDFIFVGTVDPAAVADTDELKGLRFIDIRQLKPGGLSAGHDVIVLKYREMLETGASRLDESALTNFEATRAILAG